MVPKSIGGVLMQMKAVLNTKPEVGAELRLVARPEVTPGHLLVKVLATALCHSDFDVYNYAPSVAAQNLKMPWIMGHEFFGEIVQVGQGVEGFAVGDRIDVVAEEAQEMILRANHQTDPKRAAQIIYDFVLRIDTLSLKLRMAVALGLMSDDAKAQCDMLIAKIKDEARGWRNYFLRGEGVVGKSNGPSAESL